MFCCLSFTGLSICSSVAVWFLTWVTCSILIWCDVLASILLVRAIHSILYYSILFYAILCYSIHIPFHSILFKEALFGIRKHMFTNWAIHSPLWLTVIQSDLKYLDLMCFSLLVRAIHSPLGLLLWYTFYFSQDSWTWTWIFND